MTKHVAKFALVGVSCSGKTTLAWSILSTLKQKGVRVDGAVNEYRREMVFDLSTIEFNQWAQCWMILNKASTEAALAARADVDVIISDRSVLDSYAHMVVQNGESDPFMQGFVKEWCKTYTRKYLMPPLKFVHDGVRTDKYRASVYEYLRTKGVREYGLITMPSSYKEQDIVEDILLHATFATGDKHEK